MVSLLRRDAVEIFLDLFQPRLIEVGLWVLGDIPQCHAFDLVEPVVAQERWHIRLEHRLGLGVVHQIADRRGLDRGLGAGRRDRLGRHFGRSRGGGLDWLRAGAAAISIAKPERAAKACLMPICLLCVDAGMGKGKSCVCLAPE